MAEVKEYIKQGIPLEDIHADVMTNQRGELQKRALPGTNIRFKAHVLLLKYFPEYFPKIIVLDKKQRRVVKDAAAARLPQGQKHSQQLYEALPSDVYGVERITEPTWKDLKLDLTTEQHFQVAITFLQQLQNVYRRLGILLADRNPGNVFVKRETLKVRQSDFGEVYDLYAENVRDVDLKLDRSVAIPKNEAEVMLMLKKVLRTTFYILNRFVTISKENPYIKEALISEVRNLENSIEEIDEKTHTPDEVFTIAITGLEDIWNTSS